MKILFFVENNHAGGMDSFFMNIINYWPYKNDDITLVCNENHPGLINIKTGITRECNVIGHSMLLNWHVSEKLFGWLPSIIKRMTQPILKIILISYQISYLKKLFKELNAEKLMVVNGAYPGGESCRAASIAWSKLNNEESIHNIRNFAAKPRFLIGWYENWIDRKVLHSVKRFIGVSKCCAESLRVRPVLTESNKIQHIYNGTPVDSDDLKKKHEINLRDKLGIGDNPFCLMLATYELRKGYEFIFNVFKLINSSQKNIHLVVCGDSSLKEKNRVISMRDRIAPNCNIHLLDFIQNGKNLIQQSNVLVVPSQEWESFGWTVIESMARGVPVVATNSGGLAEVIGKNGESGFSIDPNDVNSFAKAIISLISDSKLNDIVKHNAYKRVSKLFNVERMVKEYAEIIRSDIHK